MTGLDGHVLTKILGHVDSKTLAKAACVSPYFSSIVSQESLWEEACSLRWPSTQNPQLKNLISSLPGGFRKFYASCFSSVVNDSDEAFQSNHGGPQTHSTSDLMWVLDVQYDNKPILSKIVWGVPYAGNFPGWFLQSPFQTDIINLEDVMDTDDDCLPTVMSVVEVGKEGEIWGKLMENIKLSWIVINKRTGDAANLSTWSPSSEQRHPTSTVKFIVRFGGLLPAVEVIKCIIEMKCRVSGTSLKMTEVGLRLEDKSGNDVNGSKGLGILERAVRYRGSNDRNKVLELQSKYLTAKSELKEVCIRTQGQPRTVWIIASVIACVSFHYLMSLLAIVVAKH